ncbi:MAG: methyltransferase domain-containing protein [Negativicutes bacterium]|nr:methyltransferase domain-containing protein [Negativicutes bacterium]
MKVFEFDGEKYKRSSRHQQEWGNSIISSMPLKAADHILDLGCGDGRLTKRLAEQLPGGKVLGIDASQGMIDSAKANEMGNLTFELKDINTINYTEEFDVIFSNAALHWVKDHENLLKRCYKALKNGGYIRFNFAAAGNCSNFFSVVCQVMAEPAFEKHFSTFEWPWYMPEPEEYTTMVQGLNFRGTKVWGENADRYFANKEELTGWINQPSIVPFLSSLPVSVQEEFRNKVIDKMIAVTSCPAGKFFETFRRINVFAVKEAQK